VRIFDDGEDPLGSFLSGTPIMSWADIDEAHGMAHAGFAASEIQLDSTRSVFPERARARLSGREAMPPIEEMADTRAGESLKLGMGSRRRTLFDG